MQICSRFYSFVYALLEQLDKHQYVHSNDKKQQRTKQISGSCTQPLLHSGSRNDTDC